MSKSNAPVSSWVPETQAERDALCEQLERLLANPLFKHSRRYPSMLRYVVEHALSGHTGQLKERTLGIEVFAVRNAVFTSFRDLRDGPVILIGAFNNNWTLRLSAQLRFSFGRDAGTHLSWIADRQNPSKRDWSVAMRAPASTV